MQDKIDDLLQHISQSHQQMARLLDTERQVVVRMAHIIHQLPDQDPELDGISGLMDGSSEVNKSVIAYLNGLADFQDALAEMLTKVMKEMNGQDEE